MLIHGFAGAAMVDGNAVYSGPLPTAESMQKWIDQHSNRGPVTCWPLLPMEPHQTDACLRLNMTPRHQWEEFPAFDWTP